ncbi:MAG: hypothetical protein LIP01_05350 [Tannerellaceae bacterium]|nr:hypothetical protein [Tannerellaceae bacterium]
MKSIQFQAGTQKYEIPNCWEALTRKQYEQLLADVARMATGEISPAMVKANYICNIMEWDIRKIDDDGLANLSWLAEQVTFLFNIVYPDNNKALEELDPASRKLFQKTPPEKVTGNPMARYLARLDYQYVPDACFCAQLLPEVRIKKEIYTGYRISTAFDTLTCSLTALQFIEARELINAGPDKLPLLAAILYHPGTYNSTSAHQLAGKFRKLPETTLFGITFNFQAFVNYLFTRTEYSLLTAAKIQTASGITTGALESLYNLSSDGLGDITTVEQMNLLQYLILLRKKLIESVRSLAGSEMEHTEISEKTGLPLNIIKSILA